jgi:hypothetical protein
LMRIVEAGWEIEREREKRRRLGEGVCVWREGVRRYTVWKGMWMWTCRIYVCVYEIRTGRLGFTMEFGGPFFALL